MCSGVLWITSDGGTEFLSCRHQVALLNKDHAQIVVCLGRTGICLNRRAKLCSGSIYIPFFLQLDTQFAVGPRTIGCRLSPFSFTVFFKLGICLRLPALFLEGLAQVVVDRRSFEAEAQR